MSHNHTYAATGDIGGRTWMPSASNACLLSYSKPA